MVRNDSGLEHLAKYLHFVSRGRPRPVAHFVKQAKKCASWHWRGRKHREFLGLLAGMASHRLHTFAAAQDPGMKFRPQDDPWKRPASWRRMFTGWPAVTDLDFRSTRPRKSAVREIMDLFYAFETEAHRHYFESIARRKAPVYPDYLECLIAVAHFFGHGAEEATRLELPRVRKIVGEEKQWITEDTPGDQRDARLALLRERRASPARCISLSMLYDAGMFPGRTREQAQQLMEDWRREGLLSKSDPVEFEHLFVLTFLTSGYFDLAGLYDEHDRTMDRLQKAGQNDPRFLKVAAAWATFIEDPWYFGKFFDDKDQ